MSANVYTPPRPSVAVPSIHVRLAVMQARADRAETRADVRRAVENVLVGYPEMRLRQVTECACAELRIK